MDGDAGAVAGDAEGLLGSLPNIGPWADGEAADDSVREFAAVEAVQGCTCL